MRSRPGWMGVTTRVLVGGGGLLLFCVVYRGWRRAKPAAGKEMGGDGDGGSGAQVGTTTSPHGAALVLPITVVQSKLASGWTVAAPIFYPPRVAVVSLLQPEVLNSADFERRTCFITCDGPLPQLAETSRDLFLFFSEYMRGTPFLHSVAASGAKLTLLGESGFSCASGCFTHIVVVPDEQMIIALGRNGPYVVSMVLMQYVAFSAGKGGNNGVLAHQITPHDVQMLLDACHPVPLVDGLRLPGTPSGSREGILRVTCRFGDRSIVFAVSSIISLRIVAQEDKHDVKTDEDHHSVARDVEKSFFTLEADVLPGRQIVIGSATLDALVKGTTVDALFPRETPDHPPVSSFIEFTGLDERGSQAQNGDDGNGSHTDADDISALWHRKLEVSVVFCNTALGVHFFVNPTQGIIHEPILTDDLLVLYYPLGDEGTYVSSSRTSERVTPPRVTIRRLTQIPLTWNASPATDDELKHNVVFHFTDWANERVSCLISDLNGIRCVQMYEEKEKWGCRTYVISLSRAILVIRWEAETSEWEMHLPHLQKFIDTLYVVQTEG